MGGASASPTWAHPMSTFTNVSCYKCGVIWGMPTALNTQRHADKESFWCPNGHSQHYAASEADKLKAKLQAQEQATAAAEKKATREREWRLQAEEEKRHTERRLAAQRGVTTRMKNRVANGVCPCCNRHFANLHRHMQTKHAGFVAEEVTAQEGQTIQ